MPSLPQIISKTRHPGQADLTIIGCGAAGLMAAIWAARSNSKLSVVIVDGASKPGAKILVAGGGRCNVTHEQVSPVDFAGTSQNSIKKVLLRFDVSETISFFEKLGVPLKRESTGKLFPVSDNAKDVLNALINEALALKIIIKSSHRVETIEKTDSSFLIKGDWGSIQSGSVVIATGGKSLPKSGSDGKGYEFCKQFGHTSTRRIFPALVPLLLPSEHFLTQISGVSVNAILSVVNSNNKIVKSFENNILFTHFGLSGPGVLDISRYWLESIENDNGSKLTINWLPEISVESFGQMLLDPKQKKTVRNVLGDFLPVRLVNELCEHSGVSLSQKCNQLSKQHRKNLLETIFSTSLPVTGDRGFQFAEVTAGGIPLNELDLKTMQSRICPGVYLCGEICDVDGRIGGFNFQWAWASGYVCGVASALSD